MPNGLLAPPDERRGLSSKTAGVELRGGNPSGDNSVPAGAKFFGYAAVYDVRAAIGNPLTYGFFEQVSSTAFSKTLQECDARFLVDHNPAQIVSRMSAGSLRLASDGTGLATDSELCQDLSYVKDLAINVWLRNITGMSFGFQVLRDDWATDKVETVDGDSADVEVRTLLEVRLIEVSAVTFPAYHQTSSEINSVARALITRGSVEAIERRAAFRPELRELCHLDQLKGRAAPGETTQPPHDEPGSEPIAPAASTRLVGPTAEQRMRAYGARFRLPV